MRYVCGRKRFFSLACGLLILMAALLAIWGTSHVRRAESGAPKVTITAWVSVYGILPDLWLFDAQGWQIDLHKGSGCVAGNRIGALTTWLYDFGTQTQSGYATFFVEPGQPYSLRLVRHSGQVNYTLPAVTCLNKTAPSAGGTNVVFDGIYKNWLIGKKALSVLKAFIPGPEDALLWLLGPPEWVNKALDITSVAEAVTSDPRVVGATLLASYPAGCEGPAAFELPDLNRTLLVEEQATQTVTIADGAIRCTLDPSGEPVTFSLVLGGTDLSGDPLEGLAVATLVIGQTGGIVEPPDPAALPLEPTHPSPNYTLYIAGAAAAMGLAVAAIGGWCAARKRRFT